MLRKIEIYGSGALIRNDINFINYVNDAIKNGDHSIYGNHRFDYKKDERYTKSEAMRDFITRQDDEKSEIKS